MERLLVNNVFQLKKFPGKGGWTYTVIHEVLPDKNSPFGWVKVKGRIDTYEISNYHLMPIGNGQLFLPVKAGIRKQIRKQEGDFVRVILFEDKSPLKIPDEFLQCLSDEPKASNKFLHFAEGKQKAIIDWIYTAKKEDTKAERISKTIENLLNGKL